MYKLTRWGFMCKTFCKDVVRSEHNVLVSKRLCFPSRGNAFSRLQEAILVSRGVVIQMCGDTDVL